MVKTVSSLDHQTTARKDPRFIVELVGPAGGGKTSLTGALCASHEGTRFEQLRPPYFRQVTDMPFFVRHTLPLVPLIAREYSGHQGRGLNRTEIALMVILGGWSSVLTQQASNLNAIALLDQGPVSMMSYLRVHRPGLPTGKVTQEWWNAMFRRWADTLDLIIWLDASIPTLIERVVTRDDWHPIKTLPGQAAADLLTHYQAVYEQVIPALAAEASGPQVLRFDTETKSTDQLCAKVRAMLSK